MKDKRVRRTPTTRAGPRDPGSVGAARALKESEGRYRSLFENMTEGVAHCRMLYAGGKPVDFVYLAVNEAFERLTGLQGVVGKKASVAVPGIAESDPELLQIYGRIALTGQPERFESFVKTLDKWFAVSAYSPGPEQFVAIFDVITERKRSEADLKLFRALVDRTGDGIHVVDPESGRFLDMNESACNALGYTRDELLKMKVMDVAVGIDHARFVANNVGVRTVGHARLSARHRRKDGTTFPTEVILSSVKLDREYLVAIVRDVSDRLEAEDKLREEEALFAKLLNTVPDRIYFKDRKGRFVRINEAVAREFGMSDPAEAVGKTDFDLFSFEHAQQTLIDEQRIMETGEPMIGFEEKETWPDGRETWVSTTKMPLRDADGRITGIIGVSRDITANRTLRAQFLEAQKMEAFGQLAGGIAHDFNNILAAMLMQLNLAESEPGLTEASQGWLKEIERTAQRATSLTRQMLLFSRREAIDTRTIDLNQVIDGVCKMLRRLVGEDIVFELKASAAPMWIEADAGMVEQIVMNLCVNARDAMPQGGRLEIGTRTEDRAGPASGGGSKPGRFVCLLVTDTGCGMDEKTRRRLFEPFFTTKPVGKGTGLGLATVYGIVKQHGGWIEVDSAPDRGTTFRVYFPFREPSLIGLAPIQALKVRGGTERILVVEDDESLRSSMAGCLRKSGYQVVASSNGAEVLRGLGADEPNFDLLVTDILMPGGLNGLQLAAQLTSAKPTLRVIAITGHYEAKEPQTLPGNLMRLPKPFTVETLLSRVRQCLDAK